MPPVETIVLVGHAAAAWFMVGVIWIVQIVHYPLFAGVGEERFSSYEREHQRRIAWVVAPAMLAELGLAAALVFLRPGALVVTGLALLIVIWVSTFALQVPAHAKLAGAFDAPAHARLVLTNWVRTVAWTARGVIAAALLV
ncbi:MAG: hypothetical protein RLN60_02020 [Phycisphaerales bacterium]